MKQDTKYWIENASKEIVSAQMYGEQEITIHNAVFASHQAVEKILKALLIELDLNFPTDRVSNVYKLYQLIPEDIRIKLNLSPIDFKEFEQINTDIYNPYMLGFISNNLPTKEDFTHFYNIAEDIYNKIKTYLEER